MEAISLTFDDDLVDGTDIVSAETFANVRSERTLISKFLWSSITYRIIIKWTRDTSLRLFSYFRMNFLFSFFISYFYPLSKKRTPVA